MKGAFQLHFVSGYVYVSSVLKFSETVKFFTERLMTSLKPRIKSVLDFVYDSSLQENLIPHSLLWLLESVSSQIHVPLP